MADVSSIDIQTEIQWFMRPYLLDFLVEAHGAFLLLPETLYLSVNLLDRYCSRRVVYKRHYQLVGCAALLISSKYGDRKERVPTVRELRSMCCNLYDEQMFIQMEWHVLHTLSWVIGHPTADAFLQIAMSETGYDPEVEHMTLYICEISLFHKEFVSVRPSVLARSALALARCILSRRQTKATRWTGIYDSGVVLDLSSHLYQISPVLQRKYASIHLSGVSKTVEGFLERQIQIARQPTTSAPPAEGVTGMEAGTPAQASTKLPQTPKDHFNAVMEYGYLTPPITPDHEMFGHVTSNKDYAILPHIFPVTPSSAPGHVILTEYTQRARADPVY